MVWLFLEGFIKIYPVVYKILTEKQIPAKTKLLPFHWREAIKPLAYIFNEVLQFYL